MSVNPQIETDKDALLSTPIEHIDMTAFDAREIIDAMAKMSFTSRDLARAAEIYNAMLADETCSIILTLAGSTSAGGCMQIYSDLIKYNMVDAVVATGASIVDMDFFEALGFKHYRGDVAADDNYLRDLAIDRIYDTYIDEDDLQSCDHAIAEIADGLEAKPHTSREFIPSTPWGPIWPPARPANRARWCRPPTRPACRCSARPSPIPAPGLAWSCTRTATRRTI
jgi:deoxyhypusine synthase